MGVPSVRAAADRPAVAETLDRRCDPTEVDCAPHLVERQVRRALTTQPGLTVSNLVVHRIRNGVCLTGVVETMNGDTDLCGLVKQVSGVDEVLNRMLVRSGAAV